MKKLGLWFAVGMIACAGPKTKVATPGGPLSGQPSATSVEAPGDSRGLVFKLREIASAPEQAPRERTVQGKPLSEREAAALWKGVPAPAAQPEDKQTFSKRDASQPVPTAVEHVKQPFPPPAEDAAAEKAKTGPLEVLRVSPEGEVGLVRELSVTFNQPMVALTSHDQSVAKDLPVKLSPQPSGHFRWVGTRTLLFTADPRFPLSTDYTVTVPKGTRSSSGQALGKEHSSRFRTAELEIVDATPNEDGAKSGLLPLIYLAFNQRVRSEAVLAALLLSAKGERHTLRLANAQEIAADLDVKARLEALEGDGMRDHAVVFRPEKPLPAETKVELTLAKGTSAGEGPRGTAKAFTRSFVTHGPLTLKGVTCGDGGRDGNDCRPGYNLLATFSNTIDWERFERSWVRIEPSVEFDVMPSGESLYINASTAPRTSYKVFVSGATRDIFGQTLAQEQSGSVEVGDAQPELSSTLPMVVLDPREKARALHVESLNVDELVVEVRRVSPADYLAYARAREDQRTLKKTLPGTVVRSETLSVRDHKNERVDTAIDLGQALSAGLGHAIVSVQPRPNKGKDFALEPILTWVQASALAVDAFWDQDELVAFTTSLEDGTVQKDVALELEPHGVRATSDGEGIARMALPREGGDRVRVLVARRGNDTVLLPEHPWGAQSVNNWTQQPRQNTQRMHTFDDRGIYRPGETVHVKGWLRVSDATSGLPELPKGVTTLRYQANDGQGVDLANGSARLNDQGGFDLSFAIPRVAHLGGASLRFFTEGPNGQEDQHYHSFQIEEFRRPEYEVKVSTAEPAHFVGRPIKLEAKASYHAGGPLAEAKTNWRVSAQKTQFTPPGRDSFTFGEQPIWWERPMMSMHKGGIRFPGGDVGEAVTLIGRTNSQGLHSIEIVPESAKPAFVHELRVSAAVEDLSRQSFADTTTLLVHPAQVYVGLRTARAFSNAGETLDVEAIVTDLDGKAVAGRPLTISLVEFGGKFEHGKYESTETEVEHCALDSGDDLVRCALHPKRGGSYRIAARVLDAQQKPSDTHLRHWVSGDGPSWVGAQAEGLELLSDKQNYAPGETAKILLRSPFAPADALLRVAHGDFVELRHVHMKAQTETVEIKLSAAHVPSLHVHADVVGRAQASDSLPEHPAYATGEVTLGVTLDHLRLTVEAKPEKTSLEPGAQTRVTVSVRDAQNKPVAEADVALVVVDEAILQLVKRETADPLLGMHPDMGSFDGSVRMRDLLTVRKKEHGRSVAEGGAVLESAAAPMMAMDAMAKNGRAAGNSAGGPTVKLRSMFEPLALFAASLRSDANGNVSANLTMPDTLTRYRVIAVAAHGGQNFGFGESAITVQKALMLRPAGPRFVNMGDKLSLPVLIQNTSDAPFEVDVAVRGTNLTLGAGQALHVTVPANDRIEVRFAGVTEKPGLVRLQFAASTGKLRDATEISLPAFTPVTDEAFATYGNLESDGATRYALALPKDVASEFGGLEVSLSSTQLSALTDALLSTLQSPYDMPEQRASRMLAALSVRDVLSAFGVQGIPDAGSLNTLVSNEIAALGSQQLGDGGFGWYGPSPHEQSEPYVSVHVSHALARAMAAKISVPPELVARLRDYVRQIPQRAEHEKDKSSLATVAAYGAYSELLWGSPDSTLAEAAKKLAGKELSSEAVGWLLHVFHARGDKANSDALVRLVLNRVSETASSAEITTAAKDGKHLLLASSKRANAVVLEGLMRSGKAPDLAPKLARGLLAQRVKGRWEGTQENVFALLALRAYFDAYEKEVPKFAARAFVGKTLAASARFEGRSTKQEDTRVPMRWLAAEHPDAITLEKKGAGRLYYRLALAYAPTGYMLTPRDHGFVVTRSYEGVDAPEDVKRNADGVWHVRAGARVRVVLTMVAPSRRHHVALVDPLPAGFEPINPALAVSEPLPDEGRGGGPIPYARMIWPSTWYGHQNLRDERVEAHGSEVEAGVYTYTYYARATTPGDFIAPPTKAEEVYAPETFGRADTARVVVE